MKQVVQRFAVNGADRRKRVRAAARLATCARSRRRSRILQSGPRHAHRGGVHLARHVDGQLDVRDFFRALVETLCGNGRCNVSDRFSRTARRRQGRSVASFTGARRDTAPESGSAGLCATAALTPVASAVAATLGDAGLRQLVSATDGWGPDHTTSAIVTSSPKSVAGAGIGIDRPPPVRADPWPRSTGTCCPAGTDTRWRRNSFRLRHCRGTRSARTRCPSPAGAAGAVGVGREHAGLWNKRG